MEDRFEDALSTLHATHPEYAAFGLDGLSNHGPMVAEALVTLGLQDAIAPFLAQYASRLRPMPTGWPLADRDRARGDATRMADWVATWEAELAQRPWRDVVREAVPDLADGVLASALHGWLRVAHAVRALERIDTPRRRRELAHGLGLWSARHQPLSGAIGRSPRLGLTAGAMLLRASSLLGVA